MAKVLSLLPSTAVGVLSTGSISTRIINKRVKI
jgi:hypothetical protein